MRNRPSAWKRRDIEKLIIKKEADADFLQKKILLIADPESRLNHGVLEIIQSAVDARAETQQSEDISLNLIRDCEPKLITLTEEIKLEHSSGQWSEIASTILAKYLKPFPECRPISNEEFELYRITFLNSSYSELQKLKKSLRSPTPPAGSIYLH